MAQRPKLPGVISIWRNTHRVGLGDAEPKFFRLPVYHSVTNTLLAVIFGFSLLGCGDATDPEPKGEKIEDQLKVDFPDLESTARGASELPLLEDRSASAPLHEVFQKTEPNHDPDWNTEILAEDAKRQLEALGNLLLAGRPVPEEIAFVVDSSFRGTALRPEMQEVFRDVTLSVRRGAASEDPGGLEFKEAVKSFQSSFRKNVTIDEEPMRWKIVRVELGNNAKTFSTSVRLETDGAAIDGGRISQTINLSCEWAGDDEPLLKGWRVEDFEEVRYLNEGESRPPFLDRTAELFGGIQSYEQQLRLGADHWYGNMDVAFGIQQGNQGISLGDANGDGREDVFVCQPSGLPSRLFIQDDAGQLTDATREAGLDYLDDARSALFIDLDGDGDQDLALGLGYALTLHENDGAGRFRQRVEVEMFSWPASIASADYDLDGDLDIYICGYTPRDDVAPGDIFANPVPYHDANNGARNFFIENRGDFDFEDVTAQVGFGENNRRFSLAASWEDYDDDGDPDLYVANDFGRNNLYRNDLGVDGRRKFVDVAAAAGVEDIAAGMSVSWADYNRDGRMDVYVSNMFSSAGGRIAYQRSFQEGAADDVLAGLRRHARGNTLFENLGDGTFRDVSIATGVTMGRWAWSSHFADLNNDAWEDLVVTNGFFTREDPGDL
ncbi:MAG: hypothetical protein ACI8XO_004588 [Verrucomicrobiales bacterium]